MQSDATLAIRFTCAKWLTQRIPLLDWCTNTSTDGERHVSLSFSFPSPAPVLQQGHAWNVWQHSPQAFGDAAWCFHHCLVSATGPAGERGRIQTGVSGWFCKWEKAVSSVWGLPLVALTVKRRSTVTSLKIECCAFYIFRMRSSSTAFSAPLTGMTFCRRRFLRHLRRKW